MSNVDKSKEQSDQIVTHNTSYVSYRNLYEEVKRSNNASSFIPKCYNNTCTSTCKGYCQNSGCGSTAYSATTIGAI